MKFKQVFIESIATQDPDVFLSSDELEKKLSPLYERLKLPYGRLELSTGIKARGYFKELRPSAISAQAAGKALAQSSLAAKDIDLLIHSSVCRDFLEPSTASVVHNALGLSSTCRSFDLSNACLGFLDAMSVAAAHIEAGLARNALIVTGENSRPLIEETTRRLNEDMSLTRKSVKKFFANLTIGSAGVAAILTGQPAHALAKLEGNACLSDTAQAGLCQGDGNTQALMMETDSEALMLAGVNLAKSCFAAFRENVMGNPNRIICHQVGSAHRNLLLESLELDKDLDFTTYEDYGNTGSAACPLTLARAWEAKFISAGDSVALLGIGSGLHCNMMGITWL